MTVEYKGFEFERPGHATVRIETTTSNVIYIDPWSKVVDGNPADADLVFSTHDDRDHYDPEAIDAVANETTTIVVYDAINTSDLDREVVRLPYGEERSVGGVSVRSVPAYNRRGGEHVRPSGEPYHPENTVTGIVLTIDGTTVYFCSDTDALEVLADLEADVVIPPIGGTYTMNRRDAADLVRSIEPDLVLPVHYDTEAIDGVDADADAFKANLDSRGIRVELF